MNSADCYHLLGLKSGASIAELKASYRRLARQYHPDVYSGDKKLAQEKFIELTEAYKFLLSVIPSETNETSSVSENATAQSKPQPTKVKVTRSQTPIECNPPLSVLEQQLKRNAYHDLQHMLKEQRFARAITLVEGLAQRIPQDPEIRQWKAIAYQGWGRYLVNQKQLDKARIYLKKALKTDPHNRSLWAEVDRDFRRIERLL
ncbi:MAG: DnaJ domain-containing protein [Symploca sp. SIO2E6]|nr:DnaJ domain-containing protein [Symploca sp. SIO2E6]